MRHWILRTGIVVLAASFYGALACSGGDMGGSMCGGGGGSAEESNAKPGGSCPPCQRYHRTAKDSNGCSLCDEGGRNQGASSQPVQPADNGPKNPPQVISGQ
ncbi:MAG: hypothetical protein HY921_08650 [Elusimicrobia bacterium]|nr:hypothetical protein [Elusimicrobiota bacterium]